MPYRVLPLALGAVALAFSGCGGGDASAPSTPEPSAASGAEPEGFPKAGGMSFQDFQSKYPAQLSLGVGASVLRQGENRVPFVVLDKGARPITNAPVALYTVKSDGSDVRGPFPADERSFGIDEQFASRQTAAEPAGARSFYAARVPFKGKPPIGVFALVRMDGRLVAAAPSPLGVRGSQGGSPPDVGDRAISVHTQTVDDVADVSELTTRKPPDVDLLQADLAEVLGRKPVVLMFATPALCQSRVCGPVVDVAEQVRSEVGARVAFIHQEIYRDNDVSQGLRPQLAAWRLASEPWTFVIDRDGTIAERFEGAISVAELRAAVERTL